MTPSPFAPMITLHVFDGCAGPRAPPASTQAEVTLTPRDLVEARLQVVPEVTVISAASLQGQATIMAQVTELSGMLCGVARGRPGSPGSCR